MIRDIKQVQAYAGKFAGIALLISLALVVAILFSERAMAVPAAPRTHHEGQSFGCKSHVAKEPLRLQELSSSRSALKTKKIAGAAKGAGSSKNIPLVFIVIGFDGESGTGKSIQYSDKFDWSKSLFTDSKSLRQYYLDMSGDRFSFNPVVENCAYSEENTNKKDRQNDGIIHVSVPSGHDDWRWEEYEEYLNERQAERIEAEHTETFMTAIGEALDAAADYMDFAKYDANDNGTLERDELAICFCIAGYEASISESYGDGVDYYSWAAACEQSEMDMEIPKVNGLALESFITIAEQYDGEASYIQAHMGTIAHELGHYIGLPDLYDITYSYTGEWYGYSTGVLSLMDGGTWGMDSNGNYSPYSLDSWSKYYLGWVEPNVAPYSLSDGTKEIGDTPLLIQTKREKEYYLAENRRFTRWDYGLRNEGFQGSKSGGIILWHIDEDVYDKYVADNSINVPTHRPAIVPLLGEVSGDRYDFLGNYIDCVEDDGWYSGYCALFDKELWSSKYKGTLGNKLDLPVYGEGKEADLRNGRTLSGIRLEFLSPSSDNMEVKLTTLRASQMAKVVAGKNSAKISWNGVDGASRYVIYMGTSKKKMKVAKVVGANAKKTWTKKGLKKNKRYYFKVVAEYRIGAGTRDSGKKAKKDSASKSDGASKGYKVLRTSRVAQIITEVKKSKYTNPKTLKVKAKKITLKEGDKKRITGTVKKKTAKKKWLPGGSKLHYVSTDELIATVTSKGVVVAKNAGTCYIYVQTSNGLYKSVKVTVR